MKKGVLAAAVLMAVFIPVSFGNITKDTLSADVSNIYESASKYYYDDDFSKSIKLCNKALSVDSQNEKVFVLKIQALDGANKIKERNKTIEKAIDLFPDSADINFYQGQVFYEKQDYENAVKYLKKSIEIKPTPRAYHTLGLSYGELKKHKDALDCFNKEVEITPILKNREILDNAKKLLTEYEPQKAYDLADEVSKSEPSYYGSYQIKAVAAADMADYTNALKNIDKAIKLYPDIYPITLYGIRDGILYNMAYLCGKKANLKYAREFKNDFYLITKNYAYQLYPSDTDYSEEGDTLANYIDYLVSHILNNESFALYKINTLITMASAHDIKIDKYTNSYMYYYNLYALALKIALEVSDQDFKQTHTTRKKIIEKIIKETSQKGDKYHDDFTQYLFYKLYEDSEKAEDLMHEMVQKRDKENAYPMGYLYEDDIDSILDYVKKHEELIFEHNLW